ncbi:thiamine-phosphate kinase [Microbacterium lacticum]
MTAPRPETVGDLGERALLARILGVLSGSSRALLGPGDDAAVLAAPDGRVVVSTDTLVHGPDFRLAWSSGFDLGWKAAAVNLADIAAMGARPTALLVALALPDDTPAAFVDDLARGLRDACDALASGCAVEGGDLTASDTLTIAITVLGTLDGADPVRRSSARPGDIVAVTSGPAGVGGPGGLGSAERGLAVLFDRFRAADGTPVPVDESALTADQRADVQAQLRPHPPIVLGTVAARGGATAMMDVSDGLLLDATRLAEASGVRIDIETAFDPSLDDAALRGGEDHALLACFPAGTALPAGFRAIGRVSDLDGDDVAGVTVDGRPISGRGGWDPHRDWDAARG